MTTGRENIARWLLEHGADPRKQTRKDKRTALHSASKAGILSIVRDMVQRIRKDTETGIAEAVDVPDVNKCTRTYAVE